MTLRLLTYSPLFKVALAVSAASLVLLLAPSGAVHLAGLSILVFCPVIWMVQSATLFEAVLPLDARRVLFTQLAVGLVLTCLPVVAWILSGYLLGVSNDPGVAFWRVATPYRLAALPIAALAIVLPHAYQPGVLRNLDRPGLPKRSLAILAITSAALLGLLPVGTATAILTVATVAALAFTWHRMPRSYQVAPAGVEGAHRIRLTTGSAERAAAHGRWWRPLLATALPGRTIFLVLLIGSMAIGDMWLMYILIMLMPDVASDRQKFLWMYTLPLPRTAMLWATLAPPVLALLAVALVGGVIRPALMPGFNAFDRASRPHERSRTHGFDERTLVPLAYWRIAPHGEPPVVRAPWGETTPTDVISLPGLALYNPYSVRKESSPELIEWQFGRATAAVHGRSFTTAEFDANGFVAPPRVTRRAPVFLIGASLALTFVILIVWLVELSRWHGLVLRPVLRHGAGILGGVVAAGVVIPDLFFMFRHSSQFSVPVGTALALRAAEAMPNTAVAAIVAALPVAAAYALLHWQFGRSDVMDVTRQG